ncbi:hypothetical protein [Roseateles aquatilis]|nr:hypothetical protein [Roseateles aquatilis]
MDALMNVDVEPPLAAGPGLRSPARTMPGLDELVRVLRNPELVFGAMSTHPACYREDPVDWAVVPAEIQRILEVDGCTCDSVLRAFQVAAEVLRRHGVLTCHGPVDLAFLEHDDCTWSLRAHVTLDADHDLTFDLTAEFYRQLSELDVLPFVFHISFDSCWPFDESRLASLEFLYDNDAQDEPASDGVHR